MGEWRFWSLIGAFIVTGILSIILQADASAQSVPLQNGLVFGFMAVAASLIGSAMDAEQRQLWISLIVPAFGLVVLGVVFLPQFQAILLGGAFGWIIVGLFLFGRSRAPMQYREAVKAMRKGDYKKAISAMDELIKDEPDDPYHYSYRARLLRMWNKPGRARRDYEQMIEKAGKDAVRAEGYNELSELEFQLGNYDAAFDAATQANALLPNEWVTSYNLGMIEDRRANSSAVIDALNHALEIKVPDSRHRLLIHLWLMRAFVRTNQLDAAQAQRDALKQERKGYDEWQKILGEDSASVVRAVMGDDVALAGKLLNDEVDITALAQGQIA